MSISAAPDINVTKQTNSEAEKFLQIFFEWSKPSGDCDASPKKRPTVSEFMTALKEHGSSWKDWQYSVEIKAPVVKGNEKKEEMTCAIINLLQAAVIKKDIEKVKCITELASQSGQDFLDELLKSKMECLTSDGWEICSNISWISNASTIHLATCWHVESLVHFLEISPHLKNVKTENSNFTPLHVAASCDDETVVTSLLIQKGANTNAKMDNHQTPLHIAAQGGFINTVITLLFEGEADVMAKDMQKGKFLLTKCKHYVIFQLGI